MEPNTRNHGRPSPRWTFLEGVGGSGAASGMPAPAAARSSPGGGQGTRQLEDRPSALRYALFAGRDGMYAGDDRPGNGNVADPVDDFGFPFSPVVAGSDRAGAFFDTTAPTVTPDGGTIHYFLQFGGRRTPYVLRHEGVGTYTSRGAVASFEWTDEERFQLPFLAVGRPYRAVVRDVVQLYEPGGPFDWSVTRTDFFDRRADAHAASLVYVVWDLDGPANDADDDRGDAGRPASDPAGPAAPNFPDDVSPTVHGTDIGGTVCALIEAGLSDAGGE